MCIKYLQKILWLLYNNMPSQEEHLKLADKEKFRLIEIYKENSELWVTQGLTGSQKALKKEELGEQFDRKLSMEILEKAFQALRASFLRQHKKYYDKFEKENCWTKVGNSTNAFFKNKLKTSKVAFTSEKCETLITFYQTNPALWNHGMIEYRDRNIPRALIQKLCA